MLAAEHGPNGGDEVNLILPGRNYGWPKSSYGRTYDGPRMSSLPIEAGIEQPLILWLPSIAPTGVTFYSGDKFPAWKGNLFVGSARVGEIPRTGALERVVFNDKLEELRRERLLSDLHQRIRDVRQGPDGLIYVVTDEDDGALLAHRARGPLSRHAIMKTKHGVGESCAAFTTSKESSSMNKKPLAAAAIAILSIGGYAIAQKPAANMGFFVTSANPKGGNLGGLAGGGRGVPVVGAGGGRGRQDLARISEHEHGRREDPDRQWPLVQLQG